MQTKTKFIIFIIIVVVVIGGLGLYSGSKPGKLDDFAKTLGEKGVKFYGAFWCTHCQAQKAAFGASKKYLPYVECSNTDNTQKQICLDNKIEGYPTWTFDNGIKINSESEPIICPINVEGVTQEGVCSNISSKYYKVWSFPDYQFSVKSPTDPIRDGNIWQFPANVQAVGEVPLPYLAEQIQFTLPQ